MIRCTSTHRIRSESIKNIFAYQIYRVCWEFSEAVGHNLPNASRLVIIWNDFPRVHMYICLVYLGVDVILAQTTSR